MPPINIAFRITCPLQEVHAARDPYADSRWVAGSNVTRSRLYLCMAGRKAEHAHPLLLLSWLMQRMLGGQCIVRKQQLCSCRARARLPHAPDSCPVACLQPLRMARLCSRHLHCRVLIPGLPRAAGHPRRSHLRAYRCAAAVPAQGTAVQTAAMHAAWLCSIYAPCCCRRPQSLTDGFCMRHDSNWADAYVNTRMLGPRIALYSIVLAAVSEQHNFNSDHNRPSAPYDCRTSRRTCCFS